MNKVIYQVHGAAKFHDQAVYSLLSLLSLLLEAGRTDATIFVFTDRPDLVPRHELLKTVAVGPAEFRAWGGPLDFVHRIKLEVLRRAVQDIGAPFIYVDGDTKWLRPPDEAWTTLAVAGDRHAAPARPVFYMHTYEGDLSDQRFPEYRRLLERQGSLLRAWNVLSHPPWPMWNAGALGVSAATAPALDDMLGLTDDLSLRVRRLTYVEQLAVTLCAAERFELRPLDDCLYHYWAVRDAAPVALRRLFAGLGPDLSVRERAAACARHRLDPQELRAMQHDVERQGFWRLWRSRMHRSWRKRSTELKALSLRMRRTREPRR